MTINHPGNLPVVTEQQRRQMSGMSGDVRLTEQRWVTWYIHVSAFCSDVFVLHWFRSWHKNSHWANLLCDQVVYLKNKKLNKYAFHYNNRFLGELLMLHLYILKFTAHAHNGHNDQILEGSKRICTIMNFFSFWKKNVIPEVMETKWRTSLKSKHI